MPRFDVYDIVFRFGVISLYGTQIKATSKPIHYPSVLKHLHE